MERDQREKNQKLSVLLILAWRKKTGNCLDLVKIEKNAAHMLLHSVFAVTVFCLLIITRCVAAKLLL